MEKTDAVAALAALAQDNRLDVYRLLVQAGPEGKSWTRLSEQFFRFDMWSSAGVRLPSGEAAA